MKWSPWNGSHDTVLMKWSQWKPSWWNSLHNMVHMIGSPRNGPHETQWIHRTVCSYATLRRWRTDPHRFAARHSFGAHRASLQVYLHFFRLRKYCSTLYTGPWNDLLETVPLKQSSINGPNEMVHIVGSQWKGPNETVSRIWSSGNGPHEMILYKQ